MSNRVTECSACSKVRWSCNVCVRTFSKPQNAKCNGLLLLYLERQKPPKLLGRKEDGGCAFCGLKIMDGMLDGRCFCGHCTFKRQENAYFAPPAPSRSAPSPSSKSSETPQSSHVFAPSRLFKLVLDIPGVFSGAKENLMKTFGLMKKNHSNVCFLLSLLLENSYGKPLHVCSLPSLPELKSTVDKVNDLP